MHIISFILDSSSGSLYLSNLRENLYPHPSNLSLVKESPAPVQISPVMRKRPPRSLQPVLAQSFLRVGSLVMIQKSFLSSVSTSYHATPPNGMCKKCLSSSALCLVCGFSSYLYTHTHTHTHTHTV